MKRAWPQTLFITVHTRGESGSRGSSKPFPKGLQGIGDSVPRVLQVLIKEVKK